MKDFEGAFSEFIDQNGYDNAEESIFSQVKDAMYAIVREAYKAGWLAAGGCEPTAEKDADSKN